ncbi:uncharacterized protein BO88DRAFT_153301 [Aspergillus vadensis CBS 113365]|uniref:Uncharacterized protein n=1 Tax=Aspergillus vadensis (strain CBS 113365 / IMI 142717 / IBT 24658) TaxID=1448311 RepID=A0A319BFZ2_ASPVC|nr:hypothetical protein BO88DRAFT_153301 [Aspergillus vadensis CBS 113365]PYH64803.1 hypothetical protein BO88DRAFT_153301 [Aspergillus vadensis CBS 113365]
MQAYTIRLLGSDLRKPTKGFHYDNFPSYWGTHCYMPMMFWDLSFFLFLFSFLRLACLLRCHLYPWGIEPEEEGSSDGQRRVEEAIASGIGDTLHSTGVSCRDDIEMI